MLGITRATMSWDLTDKFEMLDKLVRERSGDIKQMRELIDLIRRMYDATRFMDVAQDKLYASIARGHRKTLVYLERGESADAAHEAAKAIAWFYIRFQGFDPAATSKYPHIAEELLAVRELIEHSAILRDAVSKTKGDEIHDA